MPYKKRRDKLRIYYDLLVCSRNKPIPKTAFMSCNEYSLHYSSIKKAVDILVSNGLLDRTKEHGDGRTKFKFETSLKGKMFISYFRKVLQLIDE